MRERAHSPGDSALLAEDLSAREAALDVAQSFLVQAPAGSGKTELLIQRYLALLATVGEPEHVLALTFTRKAAGEMRQRVLKALHEAASGAGLDAGKPHEAALRRLANAALARDASRGWNLLDNPARMRVMTFDALATSLVRSAPLSAALGPAPGYTDDARELYRAAAAAALADASADDPNWRRLLAHLHNNADTAIELLGRLLAKRDQLLRHVGGLSPPEVRESLSRALAADVDDSLAALRKAFPAGAAASIPVLAREAASFLASEPGPPELAAQLAELAKADGLPPPAIDALPQWRVLAGWLLNQKDEPRRAVDKRLGFPAAGKGEGAQRRADRIEAMKGAIADMAAVPGLVDALAKAARLPLDATIGEAAWSLVDALLVVLRDAVAHLALTFAERGSTDFVEASIGALRALGDEDAPSELLERIDYRLSHLLIDEFQDTSATQLELVRRLTSGWTPGVDGRTVFAVGDPMQSIYRFREAEVRLFVEAQQRSMIAAIPVRRLTLRRNFRSQQGLVEWINRGFPAVLGTVSDPTRGAVRFEPAAVVHDALPGQAVSVDLVDGSGEESDAVVARVRAALDAGAPDIAILVRARSHLSDVLPALRDNGIAFTAVELDRLGHRQAVRDLLALTHAMLQPADRLSCLAVLRAPWCGIALPDLFAVAQGSPTGGSLLDALDRSDNLSTLTPEGRARVARVLPILQHARDAHGRTSVAARAKGAWLALGGPACLSDPLDLETADRYFEALAEHERAGDVPDWDAFVAALDELNASSDPDPKTRVQVMTMHKAKGLQFDTVILPGLGRRGRGESHEILRWRSRERGLLIAPSASPGDDPDPVYAYLKSLEAEESDAELGRLLYVACTRAKSRLHLVAAPGVKVERSTGEVRWSPMASSSLARLWPAVAADAPIAGVPPPAEAVERPPPKLARLPLAFTVVRPDDGLAPFAGPPDGGERDIPFDWAAEAAREVGIVAHRLLARVALDGLDEWPASRLESIRSRLAGAFAGAGLSPEETRTAVDRVQAAVRATLEDPRGRWLFDPAHDDARSEWALAGVEGDAVVHVVLDRTFIADGVRWIVDFKTGSHEGGDAEAFLDAERDRYRRQLERYARIVGALDPARPVRLALYYPLVPGGFRSWDAGDPSTGD